MQVLNEVHQRVVHTRRVRSLTKLVEVLLPQNGSVLDVGCGDGWLARQLSDRLPQTTFCGIDVLVRDDTHVPVASFDGREIPYPDDHFDAVMMIDVLHHTEDPSVLLREAKRVARTWIVLKDHTRDGLGARATLRLMDWVGNAHHGVALPYNYFSRNEWYRMFDELGLAIDHWNPSLGLYGTAADCLFGRSLHFIARLQADSASME